MPLSQHLLNKTEPLPVVDFDAYTFHPPVDWPEQPIPVVDLTETYDRDRLRDLTWAIGRYDEVRTQAMYSAPQYESARCVHMGLDIWAPAGTPIYACYQGLIAASAYHGESGNYGGTVITRHQPGDTPFWVLHGHLSRSSVDRYTAGTVVEAGTCIGALGTEAENGGWVPHLHIQLALHPPENADYPGVVYPHERDDARHRYPDPRHVLGAVY